MLFSVAVLAPRAPRGLRALAGPDGRRPRGAGRRHDTGTAALGPPRRPGRGSGSCSRSARRRGGRLAGVGERRTDYEHLVILLAVVGAVGSANAASGRAVMHWFDPRSEGSRSGSGRRAPDRRPLRRHRAAAARGLAGADMDVRCTGAPAWAALAGAMLLRNPGQPVSARPARPRAAGARSAPAALVVAGRRAVRPGAVGDDELHGPLPQRGRGMSAHAAALVLAASQVRRDRAPDRRRPPVRPERFARRPALPPGAPIAASFGVVAATTRAPLWCSCRCSSSREGSAMSWNGLAFVAAAEIAGPHATGRRDRPAADVARRRGDPRADRDRRGRLGQLMGRPSSRRAVPAPRVGAVAAVDESQEAASPSPLCERLGVALEGVRGCFPHTRRRDEQYVL